MTKEIQPSHTDGDCIPLLLDMQVVMQILGNFLMEGKSNEYGRLGSDDERDPSSQRCNFKSVVTEME